MGDVSLGRLEVTMGVDTTGLKEAEKAVADLGKSVEVVTRAEKRELGILEEIEVQLKDLQEARKKAFTYEEISRFNKKIAETRMYMKEYATAGMEASVAIQKKMGLLQNTMSRLSGTAAKLGVAMLAAFSVYRLIQFTKEAIKLSVVAEGIATAFENLEGTMGIMPDLKAATRGMVATTDLQQMTIMATNLKVPVQDLAKYLTFATNRAITTGKSVKELSEVIIRGLGRKSSRALIELGISVEELQKAIKETGSFAAGMSKIMDQEMQKMGVVTDTAAVRLGRFTTAIEEFKQAWGDFASGSFMLGAINGLTQIMNMLSNQALTAKPFWMSEKRWAEYQKDMEESNRLTKDALKLWEEWFGIKQELPMIETVNTLTVKLQAEQEALKNINETDREGQRIQRKVIADLEKRIKLVMEGEKAVNQYRLALEKYEAQLKTAAEAEKLPTGLVSTVSSKGITYPVQQKAPVGGFEFEETNYARMFQGVVPTTPMAEMQTMLADLTLYSEAFADRLGEVPVVMQTMGNQADWLRGQMQTLWDGGLRPGNELFDMYNTQLIAVETNLGNMQKAQERAAQSTQMMSSVIGATVDLAYELGNAAGTIENAWLSMASAVLAATRQIIMILLEKYVASLLSASASIAEKETSKRGIIGVATAAAGIGLLMAMMEGAKSKAKSAAKMSGGGEVPPGYPNDTYPALLSSRETVFPPGKLPTNNVTVVVEGTGWELRGYTLHQGIKAYQKHLDRTS